MKFGEMNLINPLTDAIAKSGYDTPTPIQEVTIPLALTGGDIMGCAQTGTGKTAAFVLPILQRLEQSEKAHSGKKQIRALILAPTRELAIQNYECFCTLGKELDLSPAVIFGGVNQAKQVQALTTGVDILVATPGRLIDLINQKYVSLSNLEIFVLDEANRMLDMGFIHDVKKIISLLPSERQTLLFSATMPTEVEDLALGLLKNPKTVKVDPVTSTVDKIAQSVYFVERESKKELLLWLLNDRGVSTALVFTRTKSNADQVARILTKSGINAMAIHGNKSQNARQSALAAFKEGRISVLAATDIAARGIDITELPFVINYNIPEEAETYIHRIGRTARAGHDGIAISLCSSDELSDFRDIEKLTGNEIRVADCSWSVRDMKPTKREKKTNVRRSEKQVRQSGEKQSRRSEEQPRRMKKDIKQRAAAPAKQAVASAEKQRTPNFAKQRAAAPAKQAGANTEKQRTPNFAKQRAAAPAKQAGASAEKQRTPSFAKQRAAAPAKQAGANTEKQRTPNFAKQRAERAGGSRQRRRADNFAMPQDGDIKTFHNAYSRSPEKRRSEHDNHAPRTARANSPRRTQKNK